VAAIIEGMRDLHPTAAKGFGNDAQIYSRGRPGFPRQALDWLVGDLRVGPGSIVVELGAGTGKFTKVLCETGAYVVAIEPVSAMLAQLAADQPEVRILRASAQNIPVASESIDAVVCAQSFHWFAIDSVVDEIRRVLKPGGVLGLIWNVRDASVGWVAELEQLVSRHEGNAPRYAGGEWRSVFPAKEFGPLEEAVASHGHRGSAEQVIVDRTASVSFVAALSEDERASLLAEIRSLISRTAGLCKPIVTMPYVTNMYWCRKNRI
jgi:ubiquinone/menaquinone biosynthesis C-methylase UbiE